jgi:hypothetical protein
VETSALGTPAGGIPACGLWSFHNISQYFLMNGTSYNIPCVPKAWWATSITRHDGKYSSEMPHNNKEPPRSAAENIMLPASCEHRADCSVGRRWVHNVPDVVSHAADIERLKVVSPLDVADIGHRAENRREQASTRDHGRR